MLFWVSRPRSSVKRGGMKHSFAVNDTGPSVVARVRHNVATGVVKDRRDEAFSAPLDTKTIAEHFNDRIDNMG